MATRKRITVEGITFDLAGPTAVSLERLYSWVVWQFPVSYTHLTLPTNREV